MIFTNRAGEAADDAAELEDGDDAVSEEAALLAEPETELLHPANTIETHPATRAKTEIR